MGLGNGNANEGNKGSNWKFDFSVLTGLLDIASTLGGGPNPTVRTPAVISSSSTGTIAAGSVLVTIQNVGAATGTVLGVSLPAGKSITFSGNGQIGAITYVATGTTFLINTLT